MYCWFFVLEALDGLVGHRASAAHKLKAMFLELPVHPILPWMAGMQLTQEQLAVLRVGHYFQTKKNPLVLSR